MSDPIERQFWQPLRGRWGSRADGAPPEQAAVVERHLRRSGLTLVELLVVVAILATLVGLLLPAVQAARETARRAACSNNVRQLALAGLQHEHASGFFPSGGWGWWWVGDADRGFGWRQPGGWLYSSLPYLEATGLFDLSRDGQAETITDVQRRGAVQTARASHPAVTCPSRRSPGLLPKPTDDTFIAHNAGRAPAEDNRVARSCYAANGGHTRQPWLIDWAGPPGSVSLTSPRTDGSNPYNWPDLRDGARAQLSGLSFVCSEVRPQDVPDGLSKTYLLGERYIDANHYHTGQTGSDNETWVTGTNNDTIRTAGWPPRQDVRGWNNGASLLFGGPHADSFCMGFADGSVRWIPYAIDLAVHANLANRQDGQPLPSGSSP